MNHLSEYEVKPKHIIVHNPSMGDSLASVTSETLQQYNFLSVPNKAEVYREFGEFVKLLRDLGVKPLELSELLSTSQREYVLELRNPNMMFTRDPAVTLPWAPGVFVRCRFSLASRQHEAMIMSKALTNYGLKMVASFDHDEYMEGGDVLPMYFHGRRILIIGFGTRTSQAAALKLAKLLVPEYIDEIIGVRHDPQVLHLDTGFTIINSHTILAAKGMFNQGFTINKTLQLDWLNPIKYMSQLGFKIIYIDKNDAINNERCNVLPLGDKLFASFSMDQETKHALQSQAGIKLHELNGEELAKAAGGSHCLSRPIY